MSRAVTAGARGAVLRLLAGLLSLCFLLSAAAPLLASAFSGGSGSSGMACCRKTKHACCKRSDHNKGPAWQGGRLCKDKCTVVPLAFGSAKPAALPSTPVPVRVFTVARVVAVERPAVAPHRQISLYQRPPPTPAQ